MKSGPLEERIAPTVVGVVWAVRPSQRGHVIEASSFVRSTCPLELFKRGFNMAKVKTISIDGVDYVRADAANKPIKGKLESLQDLVGSAVFIRTVTYHGTGRVVGIVEGFIELDVSAWIADSGRFMNALKDGELNEVEPTDRMWVSIASIVDFFEWKHELPKEQK